MGLIPKTICLVKKDLKLMSRNISVITCAIVVPILLIIAAAVAGVWFLKIGPPEKDRFRLHALSETVKFPGLSMYNKTEKCQQFENYLDGELVEWNNVTKTVVKTGKRNTPEELIKAADDVIINTETEQECFDALLHGYFMNSKTKEITSIRPTLPSSFASWHHYRMMMLKFGIEENITKLNIDGLHILPVIETVTDKNSMYTAFVPAIFSFVILFPLFVSMSTLIGEKEVIQPYFETFGVQPWFFYFVHMISGALRLWILIIFALGAMMWLKLSINYAMFILGTFVFTLGATAFILLMGTMFKNIVFAFNVITLTWFPAIAYIVLQIYQFTPKFLMGQWNIVLNLHIVVAYNRFFTIATSSVDSTYGLRWFQTDVKEDYPLIVYMCFMIFDTIWMVFLGIFWKDVMKTISGVVTKIRFGSSNTTEDFTSTEKSDNEGNSYMDNAVLGCQDLPMRKDLKAGIELKNAGKVYSNGYRALNGVTMRAMNGQVTCLLGANGAGKSTIFSMITNITKPTYGTVKVFHNKENTDGGKSLIGYCPQYNPLMDQLTVLEHLKLVDVLKDSPCKNFDEESMELLTLVGLYEKRDELAGRLSGGMKRKLCVCMALIGGSQIVLLDEPTAGMDPAARRDIQKILTKCKKDRTVLLTTHFMDEAEAVADWVFVLTNGKLAAAGISSYLKKKYFDGFLTNVVVSDKHPVETSAANIKALFEHYIPGSSLMFQRGFQFEMYIPNAAKETFSDFLALLEDIMNENFSNPKFATLQASTGTDMSTYSVVTFGLSDTTLEQVLLTICNKTDELTQNKSDKKIDMMDANYKALVDAKNEEPKTGVCTVMAQLYSLFMKRFTYTLADPFDLFGTLVQPCLIVWFVAFLLTKSNADFSQKLSLSDVGYGVVIVQFNGTENRQILDYLGKYSNLDVKIEPLSTEMSKFVLKYNDKLCFILRVHENHNVVLYNAAKEYLVDMMTEFLGNMLYLKSTLNPRIEEYTVTIQMINTIRRTLETVLFFAVSLTAFGFGSVFFGSVSYLGDERKCQFDLMQKLTGVSFWLFYVANMIYAFVYYAIVISVAYFLFWWYDQFDQQFLLLAPFFLLFFLNLITLVSVVSQYFESSTSGLYGFLAIVFIPNNLEPHFHVLRYISPTVSFMRAFGKIKFSPVENAEIYHIARKQMYQFDELWGEGGLHIELICMTVQLLAHLVLLYSVTSQKLRVAEHNMLKKPLSVLPSTNELTNNSALRKERELIEENYGQPSGCTVVVDKLIQQYGKVRALNGISFTVKASECFGLLGVNGAGKTTTFDILTGRRLPRGGDATIDCVSVMDKVTIGFCPQVDALMDHLTGRQCFYLFARLHRYNDVDEVVRVLLECVEMTEHCNKTLKRMSGGQRRRISVGVAILSRSHCMILDEPTTGIDPIARRELWNVLNNVRQSAGTSIILTSHSMDECQALCGRITILQKGEMVALGTSQEYMTEYGEFFTVVFTVSDQSQRDTVAQEALENLKDAELATTNFEFDQNIYIKWKKTANDKWSEKFATVAKVAQQLKCSDFMLTQATLEDAVVKLTGGETEQSKESVNNDKEKGETVQSKENTARSKEETKTDATATKASGSQTQTTGGSEETAQLIKKSAE